MRDHSPHTQRLLEIVVGQIVRPSFDRCCANGDEFIDSFYVALSDMEPAVGPLFAQVDMKMQNQLLQAGIRHLFGFAEGNPESKAELTRLSRSHGPDGLNIQPEWYRIWLMH